MSFFAKFLASSLQRSRIVGRKNLMAFPLVPLRILRPWRHHPYPGAVSLAMMGPSSERPSVWLALSVLAGLPLALWAYKCLMLVIFQRKIIYMGYAPIGARDEDLADVPKDQLKGLVCEEINIANGRTSSLSGIVVRSKTDSNPKVAIIYFQGNAGNPLHRLPVFQTLLSTPSPTRVPLHIISVAPRSYWKSTPRRPTQAGILSDYRHVLDYALTRYPSIPIILYGHSLGGAIAVCLTSQLSDSKNPKHRSISYYSDPRYQQIKGLILENPFTSVPDMVQALYPERWVPYRYLAPLVFDKWNAHSAMTRASNRQPGAPETVLDRLRRDSLILVSEKDEVVPPQMSLRLAAAARNPADLSNAPKAKILEGALHENAWQTRTWRIEITRYISEISRTW
ncbi:hypothetical protein PC9H_006742 [Pleurotus ostreatus]|uniref:Fungal lipase-type domain-containing protein n=1 Tax=Pleurotus ostreatus TaxID=5322 RepID=A0A8H7DVW1_PLEOS|nr:uncharacterized protein PC9H_006742 [Pleurotus ostreatus]KAF7431027.1 hypothetical protein PC9H_006742 [Pleurotus ostreatus]